MGGLRNICKAFGGMKIQGVQWYWDYVADEPVKASEMPIGSERWLASERAKYAQAIDARSGETPKEVRSEGRKRGPKGAPKGGSA